MNDDSPTDDAPARASRRTVLSKGVLAAAVGTVVGVSASRSASAADGGNLIIGQGNTGSSTTELSGGSSLKVSGGSSDIASLDGETSSNGTTGVRGNHTGSNFGFGVLGSAAGANGYGVYGTSAGQSGFAVYGQHSNAAVSGTGVFGQSQNGAGVLAQGTTADIVAARTGRIQLNQPFGINEPAPAAPGAIGSIARDATGALWYAPAPDRWVRVAGSTTAGALELIDPKRIYDSRAGSAPLGVVKGKLQPGQNRVIDCTVASSGVPATARGVVINLTAANTVGRGNLAVYPDGSPVPSTSTLNYVAGVNVANGATVRCGPGAKIRVACGGSTGADFIVDITGYFL